VDLHRSDDPTSLGRTAAALAANLLADTLAARGRARNIAATGASP
jgi:hypothetical protein